MARSRVGVYNEERGNGTPLQVNDTQSRDISGNLRGTTPRGQWSVAADDAEWEGLDVLSIPV